MLVDPETQLLTDWTMKFLSMLATWFAACGTTAAVVVALWLARRSDKVRLNASVGVYVMFESDRSEEGMLIAVTNLGDRPVTIASVSWTIGKWKADNRSAIDKNVLNQCPAKLEHGETKHFFTSFSHGSHLQNPNGTSRAKFSDLIFGDVSALDTSSGHLQHFSTATIQRQ